MTRFPIIFLAFGCLFVLSPSFTPLHAQVKPEICDNGIDDDGDGLVDCDDPDCVCKKEICDNKIDDDGDGLVDCDDPDCVCAPPEGLPCSHGFWKNHTELWFGVCCQGEECDQLLADLNAKGPGSEAIRQAAADHLEECLGRPCNETDGDEEDSRAVGDAVRDLNLLFCSSTPAPAVAGSEEKNESRPVDVTGTVENLHRVFGDA